MRALRRVVGVRTTAAAAVVLAALAVSGCAKFDAAMSQQEAVVTFNSGTTQATMLKVGAACDKVPDATAETVPPSLNATSGTYDVRYRVDQASDADIALLSKCLSQFKSVQGISLEQEDGS
jgi:DMSO/TMAO reductase YedYZ molybdopterin-dependent catalytic subunit